MILNDRSLVSPWESRDGRRGLVLEDDERDHERRAAIEAELSDRARIRDREYGRLIGSSRKTYREIT